MVVLLSLGTKPSFPGQNIEGTLRGNAQCTDINPTPEHCREILNFLGNLLLMGPAGKILGTFSVFLAV